MNKNIVKYIAIFFIINFILSVMFALGFNIWNFSGSIKKDRIKQEKDKEYREERKKDDILYYFYYPKIDSLIENNPKVAIQYIDRIIPKYQSNKELFFKKGVAYYEIDSLYLALIEFDKSMINYTSSKALEYKANIYLELNLPDKAIKELLLASKKNSDYLIDIARIYEINGNYEKSLECYKQVLQKWNKDELHKWREFPKVEKKIIELEKIISDKSS